MKKKYALLMPVLLSGMLVACGNASTTQNSSTVSETSAAQMVEETSISPTVEEKSLKSDTENPLYVIIERYKDGNFDSPFNKEIGKSEFQQLCTEYSKYMEELGTYITDHAYDFAAGKTFKDFGDYENTFSDFYNWAGNLIYFNGTVSSEYQQIWGKFKNMLIEHINVMDEIYTANGNEVVDSLNALFQYINDETANINGIMLGGNGDRNSESEKAPSNYSQKDSSSNNTANTYSEKSTSSYNTTSGYSGSYDAELKYSDSSSVVIFISEDAMERFMTALSNNNQGTIDELISEGQVAYTERGTKCNIVKKKFTKAQVKLLDGAYAGTTVWVVIEAVQEK